MDIMEAVVAGMLGGAGEWNMKRIIQSEKSWGKIHGHTATQLSCHISAYMPVLKRADLHQIDTCGDHVICYPN